MELSVYLDESGNTGDAIFKRSIGYSFSEQPSFALAGVAVLNNRKLEEVVQELKLKHNVHAQELKASRFFDKKPKFIQELIETLLEQEYPIFIELMDKRYFVASNIVLFYLMYDLTIRFPQFKGLESHFADLISEYLDDIVLVGFSELCRSPSKENLIQFTKLFRDEVSSATDRGAPCENLLRTIKIVSRVLLEAEQDDRLDEDIFARFLPPPDQNKRGEVVAMLPHVSAFGSMYARINRFASEDIELKLIHDEHAHFDEILKIWEETLRVNRLGEALKGYQGANFNYVFTDRATLEFDKSHMRIGIQVADVIAGFCSRYFNRVLAEQLDSIRCYRSIVELLGSMYGNGQGLNIVASEASVRKFYSV
jgi:Protein of unknown function (DUF3800)